MSQASGPGRRTLRRGFQLTELLVAIAIAAGPMLLAIHLVQSNAAGARFNHERAMARLILVDLSEILIGEPVEKLRTLDQAPGDVAQGFSERIAKLPDSVREKYRAEVTPYLPRIKCRVEENLDGEAPDLARLVVKMSLTGGVNVEIKRLFRPAARLLPRGAPRAATQ